MVSLDRNLGAAARTVGVNRARTPHVAFSDDDSWWAPGSLHLAADVVDGVTRLGLVAAQVLVRAEERLDPVCRAVSRSPLGRVPGAGPRVLGFVACGSVVRRSAYLDVGGFHPRYEVGGEEALLALDPAERGWACAYVPEVVAHHHPSAVRTGDRRAREVRNDVWTLWLRRRGGTVLSATTTALLAAASDRAARSGMRQAVGGWRWVMWAREQVSGPTERALHSLRRQSRLDYAK